MNEMQILFVKDGKLADVSWSRHQLILLGLGLVRHMPFDGFKNYKILQAFIFSSGKFRGNKFTQISEQTVII